MKMHLTKSQLNQLEIIVTEAAKLSVSRTRPDRAAAESAINVLYKKAGLSPPKRIIWCGSPFAMALGDLSRAIGISDGTALRTALDLQRPNILINKTVWKSAEILSEIIEGEVFGYSAIAPLRSMRGGAARHLWENVTEFWALRDKFLPAADGRREMLFKRAIERLSPTAITAYLDEAVCNPYECGMYAFYSYLCGVTGAWELKETMDLFLQLAGCAGWVIPYENLCFVSDKPVQMACNEVEDLHSTAGPALEFADGTAVYAIDGIVVSDFIVTQPQKISPRMIDNERNAAMRRIMMRQYCGNFYDDCGATLAAEDRLGRLYRKKRLFDTDFTFIRVTNSSLEPDGSRREYVLRVPPTMQTPTEAIAWTFGMTPEEYLKTQKMT